MKEASDVDGRIQVLGKLAPLNGTKISYNGFIEDLLQESSSRSWYWQTCTEFGYYQLAGSTIFPTQIDMDYFTSVCKDAFFSKIAGMEGITLEETKEYVKMLIDSTNAWYGARNIPRDHIYYTNGKVDPWSELGIVSEKTWADGQFVPENTDI